MVNKINTCPQLLLEHIRDGLVEEEHYGFIVYASKNKITNLAGNSKNYPFYLRSCAKPLQASLIIDFGMDNFFDMTEDEIAICCASHAGEKVHTQIASRLLKKIGLSKKYLKCGLHKPLSKTRQNEMLINGETENILQNNCSGKHIMMLGLCQMNNWDLNTYDKLNHPLQQAIKNKIYELCEVDKTYPITKDGCGVPIMSMPLENIIKGYLKLFCCSRYEKIKFAFLNKPYIIGGEERTDTKIMNTSENIVAKVGAGGLCTIVNTKTEEGFIVKISDCDMKAREFIVIELLKKLQWTDINISNQIKTLHNEVVGQYHTCLNLIKPSCAYSPKKL